MVDQTDNVKKFLEHNKTEPVTVGEVRSAQRGARYWISDTKYEFTLEEVRSMGMPKWPWDFPEYQNTREQGEFGEGCTIRRAPEHG